MAQWVEGKPSRASGKLRLTICRKWDSKSPVWCMGKQKGDAKGSLFYVGTVQCTWESLILLLLLSLLFPLNYTVLFLALQDK